MQYILQITKMLYANMQYSDILFCSPMPVFTRQWLLKFLELVSDYVQLLTVFSHFTGCSYYEMHMLYILLVSKMLLMIM